MARIGNIEWEVAISDGGCCCVGTKQYEMIPAGKLIVLRKDHSEEYPYFSIYCTAHIPDE